MLPEMRRRDRQLDRWRDHPLGAETRERAPKRQSLDDLRRAFLFLLSFFAQSREGS